jgi:hypothetical protein
VKNSVNKTPAPINTQPLSGADMLRAAFNIQPLSEADVLHAAFESLDKRPASPRRVAPGALEAQGLQRWVRVEGPVQLTEDHLAPRSSKALMDLRAFTESESPLSFEENFVRAKRLNDLHVSAKTELREEPKTQELMESHVTNSAGSPFLSGTPFLTQDQINFAQLSLIDDGNLAITVSYTNRAFPSPFNKREDEALLPVAEHPREMVGVYTLHKKMIANGTIPHVESYYHDLSGDQAVTYTNAAADAKFTEIASPQSPINWNSKLRGSSSKSVSNDAKTDWRRWGYGTTSA